MMVSILGIMNSKATENTSIKFGPSLKTGPYWRMEIVCCYVLRLLYFYSLEESQCTEYTLFNHSTIILLSSKGLGERK